MIREIYSGSIQVGIITAREGDIAFSYDDAWRNRVDAFPLSLSMPLSQSDWGSEQLLPWLQNLLPEGDPLRAVTRLLGVAREDVLGLVTQLGRDLAGALSFKPESADAGYRPIESEADLERILNELPARPFLAGEDGVSMSLAGAQDKLPVALIDGKICIPINGAPSTHILKPDNPRFPGSVQNEALCMVLAKRCGLPVAEVTTGVAGARHYLLVTRYDRITAGSSIVRMHQEDFCQALGRSPAAKYEHNQTGRRGPSIPDMIALIREHMTARDINRFLDAVIFNIAIGNVDSHAKNYSILLGGPRPELAPLYDLMSGLAWQTITTNHAQEIGGQRKGRYMFARHWRRLAEASGVSATATLKRVSDTTETILDNLSGARAEIARLSEDGTAFLTTFESEIEQRARLLGANVARNGEPEASE